MSNEKTFVLIKPDGVKRGLAGEILRRIEQRNLKVVALKMILPTKGQVDTHYPKNRAWIENLGINLFKAAERYKIKIDFKKEYGTTDPYKIGRLVRGWLIDFMTSGPVVVMVVQGIHAIDMVRKIVGPTIPAFAEMGTIRGDFSVDSPAIANPQKRAIHNLIHASGDRKEARHEIRHWFLANEIQDYKRVEDDLMF